MPMSYLSQQALWTLLTASLEQVDSPLLRMPNTNRLIDLSLICPMEALCNIVADMIFQLTFQSKTTSVVLLQSVLSATFLGLHTFTTTYNSLVRQSGTGNERIAKGFHSMLELYHTID